MSWRDQVARFVQTKLKGFWPIRWKEIVSPNIILPSLAHTPRWIRYTTISLILITIISFIASFVSLYFAITKVEGAKGGYMREGVVGGDMDLFNPLIDRTDLTLGRENNNAEKKVYSLLYLPLYEIQYPNFLTDSITKPSLRPILLAKVPEWKDAADPNLKNRFKRLEMELRSDLTWSNGERITVDDIEYSFLRLKEERGNPEFRTVIKKVGFEKLNERSFVFISETSNPELIYKLNFRPISKNYFGGKNTDQIIIDERSIRPQVTSGGYIIPDTIDNPESPRKEKIINPQQENQKVVSVILANSQNKNIQKIFGTDYNIEYYIVKKYDRIDGGDGNSRVLAAAVQKKEIDYFERAYESDIENSPQSVNQSLNLNQIQKPTNTFATMYLNIKRGPTGYLINQSLRKYIVCHMLEYKNTDLEQWLTPVPKEKRVVPIEIGEISPVDCGSSLDQILDSNYDLDCGDSQNKIKRVCIVGAGQPIILELVTLPEMSALASSLQIFFRDTVGVPISIISDAPSVSSRLINKNYHIALLPNFVTSRDLSEDYSVTGRDLSSIPSNDRITQYKVNENLQNYSLSDTQDKNARQQLIEFFGREYISLNLYQYRYEYNYDSRLKNITNSIPSVTTTPFDIYRSLNTIFINSRRVLNT